MKLVHGLLESRIISIISKLIFVVSLLILSVILEKWQQA